MYSLLLKTIKILFLFFICICALLVAIYLNLPRVGDLRSCITTTMNRVPLCLGSKGYATLSQISPYVVSAIVISEDVSFYQHNGFDLDELKNSLEQNIKELKFVRGGSTITQQLAKNIYLSKDKTLLRKFKEIILTKRIEEKYSKNFILEKYLNVIELGPHIFGIKQGAQYYFQKKPKDLSPLESAFIAFLLPSPIKYSISFKKKELTPYAEARIKDILYKMHFYKKISADEYQSSLRQLQYLWKPIPPLNENEEDEYNTTEEGLSESERQSISRLKDFSFENINDDQEESPLNNLNEDSVFPSQEESLKKIQDSLGPSDED